MDIKHFVINRPIDLDRYLSLNLPFEYTIKRPTPLNDTELLSLSESGYIKHRQELSLQLTVRDLLKNNNGIIGIYEDDVYFDGDVIPYISNINTLPSNFDFLLLGAYIRQPKGKLIKHNDFYYKMQGDFDFIGCHAIIYNTARCNKIVSDFSAKKQLPLDGYYFLNIVGKPNYNVYIATELTAWQSGSIGFHGLYCFEELKSTSLNIYNQLKIS